MIRKMWIPIALLALISISCSLTSLAAKSKATSTAVAQEQGSAHSTRATATDVAATPSPEATLQPTSTPVATEPAATETSVPTQADTATSMPADTATPAGCPAAFTESFDGSQDCWDPGDVTSVTDLLNPKKLSYGVSGGEFQVNANDDDELYLYWFKEDLAYTNVTIEADVLSHEKSTTGNDWILACRTSNQGWYEVRLQPAGLYDIYMFDFSLRDDGKNPYVHIQSGGAKSIRNGVDRVNTMAFTCTPDKLTFTLNDTQIWTGPVPAPLPDGGIAIGVATVRGKFPSHYAFEEIRVSQ